MPVFGVTGGIATGKSTFLRYTLERRSARLYDADRSVHRLLESDRELHEMLGARLGPGIFDALGKPERSKLREIAFTDSDVRRDLEHLLHPRIKAQWLAEADRARRDGDWLYVDLPLLYETEAEKSFDKVIVVACSPETQNTRLKLERGLAPGLIASIIGAQLDLGEKMARADHVIWNDSTPAALAEQARLLLALHTECYG